MHTTQFNGWNRQNDGMARTWRAHGARKRLACYGRHMRCVVRNRTRKTGMVINGVAHNGGSSTAGRDKPLRVSWSCGQRNHDYCVGDVILAICVEAVKRTSHAANGRLRSCMPDARAEAKLPQSVALLCFGRENCATSGMSPRRPCSAAPHLHAWKGAHFSLVVDDMRLCKVRHSGYSGRRHGGSSCSLHPCGTSACQSHRGVL